MPPASDPSAMATAFQWASRIVTVSLEMVLPGLAGVFVDRYLGTLVVFTLLGFALGFAAAGWHLAAMIRAPGSRSPSHPTDETTPSED